MAPTTYQRKPGAVPRTHCNPAHMKAALEEVVKGNSLRYAAELYNINRLTLNRYYMRLKEKDPRLTQKKVANTSIEFFIPNYKKRQIFTSEMEMKLAYSIAKAAEMVDVITTVQIRRVAYGFAVKHEIAVPDIWHKNHMAGFEWYRAFIERHSHLLKILPLRSGQGLPLPPKKPFKKPSISHSRSVHGHSIFDNMVSNEDVEVKLEVKIEPDEDDDDDTVIFSVGMNNDESDDYENTEDVEDDDGAWIIVVD